MATGEGEERKVGNLLIKRQNVGIKEFLNEPGAGLAEPGGSLSPFGRNDMDILLLHRLRLLPTLQL